jgi:hypothetical protein
VVLKRLNSGFGKYFLPSDTMMTVARCIATIVDQKHAPLRLKFSSLHSSYLNGSSNMMMYRNIGDISLFGFIKRHYRRRTIHDYLLAITTIRDLALSSSFNLLDIILVTITSVDVDFHEFLSSSS